MTLPPRSSKIIPQVRRFSIQARLSVVGNPHFIALNMSRFVRLQKLLLEKSFFIKMLNDNYEVLHERTLQFHLARCPQDVG